MWSWWLDHCSTEGHTPKIIWRMPIVFDGLKTTKPRATTTKEVIELSGKKRYMVEK